MYKQNKNQYNYIILRTESLSRSELGRYSQYSDVPAFCRTDVESVTLPAANFSTFAGPSHAAACVPKYCLCNSRKWAAGKTTCLYKMNTLLISVLFVHVVTRLKCTWIWSCSRNGQMNTLSGTSSLTHWSQQIALELINWGCVCEVFEWCGQKKIQKLWMTIHCWQIIHSLMRYSLSHSPTHCRSSCRTYWVASGRSSQSPPIHTAGSYCILLRTGTH